jgi:hypothetical protein
MYRIVRLPDVVIVYVDLIFYLYLLGTVEGLEHFSVIQLRGGSERTY